MGSITSGIKVLENELVVVYEARIDGHDQPLAAVAVAEKGNPEHVTYFGDLPVVAQVAYSRAYWMYEKSGKWPERFIKES